MESNNDLKIELYPDKKPRLTFEKQPLSESNCFSTKLSSLSPDKELANKFKCTNFKWILYCSC